MSETYPIRLIVTEAVSVLLDTRFASREQAEGFARTLMYGGGLVRVWIGTNEQIAAQAFRESGSAAAAAVLDVLRDDWRNVGDQRSVR